MWEMFATAEFRILSVSAGRSPSGSNQIRGCLCLRAVLEPMDNTNSFTPARNKALNPWSSSPWLSQYADCGIQFWIPRLLRTEHNKFIITN